MIAAGDAGDAGSISRGSSGKTSAIAFSAVQLYRLQVLKAASNAFVAEEQALEEPGAYRDGRSLQNGLYPHRGQADGPLEKGPASQLLPTPPAVSFRRT
jgi:hypothetical protein